VANITCRIHIALVVSLQFIAISKSLPSNGFSSPPCQALSTEFEAAAAALHEQELPVSLISIDCAADPEICDSYEIHSHPTIRELQGLGKMARYRGRRTADACEHLPYRIGDR
jgi:hypothetical protein